MGNAVRVLLDYLRGENRELQLAQVKFRCHAFRAAKKGDVDFLQELAGEVPSNGSVPLCNVIDGVTGRTLLHTAMEHGNSDCIRFLVQMGCDLQLGDSSNETPLHAACMSDSVEGLLTAVEIDEDLDWEIKDMWKRTLLMKALVYNSQRVLLMMLERSKDINLDTQDITGLSPLHVAVSYNRLNLVRELAARGASLNLMNEKGRTPLSLAITSCNVELVRELLVLGANTCLTKSNLPVVTAISEVIRRAENGVLCSQSIQILHLMLAAHGHPIHADEPNVFGRILQNSDTLKAHISLLLKLYLCSDVSFDNFSFQSIPHSGPRNRRPQTYSPMNLTDLAKRSTRCALMRSGHNVVWAVERLNSTIPPAVKSMLLLKDYDK